MTTNERIAREVFNLHDIRPGISGGVIGISRDDSRRIVELPDFEHSLDACAIAEAEIVRRGYRCDMITAIQQMWQDSLEPSDTWFILQLTPAERCAAMLKVVEGWKA